MLFLFASTTLLCTGMLTCKCIKVTAMPLPPTANGLSPD